MHHILAGWWCDNHLEKYDFINGKDDIPYMTWKIKKCWKPPTSEPLFLTINSY